MLIKYFKGIEEGQERKAWPRQLRAVFHLGDHQQTEYKTLLMGRRARTRAPGPAERRGERAGRAD
jgi:hypothetical protein